MEREKDQDNFIFIRLFIFHRDISIDNLQYLTSEQALADLATFHKFFNDKYQVPDHTKWISFGGSYPGLFLMNKRFFSS